MMNAVRRIVTVIAFAVAALITGGTAATWAATGPHISLNPSTGIPGTIVTVRGSGFCASGCSTVQILFGGTQVTRPVAAGSDGTIRATFSVPGGLSVLTHYVTAAQRNAAGVEVDAQAPFVYRLTSSSPAGGGGPIPVPSGTVTGPTTTGGAAPAATTAPATKRAATPTTSPEHTTSTSATRSTTPTTLATAARTVKSSSGGPIWPWIVGGIAVAALIAYFALRLRRRSTA